MSTPDMISNVSSESEDFDITESEDEDQTPHGNQALVQPSGPSLQRRWVSKSKRSKTTLICYNGHGFIDESKHLGRVERADGAEHTLRPSDRKHELAMWLWTTK